MESKYRAIIVKGLSRETSLLDYISKKFTYLSQDEWLKEDCEGFIELNGKRAEGVEFLHNGDELVYKRIIPEPEVDSNYSILYEDDSTLVVVKPGNLPVHPAGRYRNSTLWSFLKESGRDVKFVNRLDRETSGILLAAKNNEALSFYNEAQRKGELKKIYRVLVHGEFPDTLDARGVIKKDESSRIRKKRAFIPMAEGEAKEGGDGQYARTLFRCILKYQGYSLVECELFTGRLHQIRATLCSLGYPVAGDKMYGLDEGFFLRLIKGELTDSDRKSLQFPRQCLHSYSLKLKLYQGDSRLFVSPLPEDIRMSDS